MKGRRLTSSVELRRHFNLPTKIKRYYDNTQRAKWLVFWALSLAVDHFTRSYSEEFQKVLEERFRIIDTTNQEKSSTKKQALITFKQIERIDF